MSDSLKNLREDYHRKMDFIRGFIEQFHDFVNKLERRVLRAEHCLFGPIGEDLTRERTDKEKDHGKKIKQKSKR